MSESTPNQRLKSRLPRVVCIVGATASGKTALSLKLAKAFQGEIINADARQSYQYFTIGTGKPPGQRGMFMRRRAYLVQDVPHYLMDFLPPTHQVTVAEWKDMALKAIRGITRRQHLPLVVGGTGLYVTALIDNFTFPKVEAKPHLRAAFENKSLDELVALLLKLDPAAAEAVDLKNPRRVIRALEVSTFTGQPFTALKRRGKPVVEAFQIGIQWPRAELYGRIEHEIDDMIERGWIDEIREIIKLKIPLDAPAMTAIGYRELLAYVKGQSALEEAIAGCKQAVRRYAKRQESWYGRDPRIHWAQNEDEAFQMVEEWLAEN